MNPNNHEQAQADVHNMLLRYPLLVDPSDTRTQEQVVQAMIDRRYASIELAAGTLTTIGVVEA